MKIYKVEVVYTDVTPSDVYSYITIEKYFLNEENAIKSSKEYKEEFEEFNKSHFFPEEELGEKYIVNVIEIETSD